MTERGFTLWLTGLSGAGKTTLARAVATELHSSGYPVEVLDGDEIRAALNTDLGFSTTDRRKHVQIIGHIANLLSRNGIAVLVSAISPNADVRAAIRSAHTSPFVEVFVDCSLPELVRRDPKGLYAKALSLALHDFTGISSPYDVPTAPELHINTDEESVLVSTGKILECLRRRGLLQRATMHEDRCSDTTETHVPHSRTHAG